MRDVERGDDGAPCVVYTNDEDQGVLGGSAQMIGSGVARGRYRLNRWRERSWRGPESRVGDLAEERAVVPIVHAVRPSPARATCIPSAVPTGGSARLADAVRARAEAPVDSKYRVEGAANRDRVRSDRVDRHDDNLERPSVTQGHGVEVPQVARRDAAQPAVRGQ